MTKNQFICSAESIHGKRYDYSMANYDNTHTKVAIKCRIHGIFFMSPSNHLAGKGCRGCAQYGFNSEKEGFVYFLMSEKGIKVGITNNLSKRITRLANRTPFDFHIIANVKTTGIEAICKEKYYHRKYESAHLTGFDGATEWLRYSPELMSEIMNENNAL